MSGGVEVKGYLEKLEHLSSEELDRSARKLVVAERRAVARLVAHICEIARRKAHLERERQRAPRPGEVMEKAKRTEEVEARRGPGVPRPDEVTETTGADGDGRPARSRHIPAEVRERVLERAGYRCEYRAADGTRCRSKGARREAPKRLRARRRRRRRRAIRKRAGR